MKSDSENIERIFNHICDSHVHIGKFIDGLYFSSEDVGKDLLKLGILKWAVSSTSTSDNIFEEVSKEIITLIDIAPKQTIPLLWVTPKMLEKSNDLRKYDLFPIYGFKIHGYAERWETNGKPIQRIFSISRERKIPILLHTGYLPSGPEAGIYEDLFKEYSEVKIILAHGRPEDQTFYLLKTYKNIYLDTAYTSINLLHKIVNNLGNDNIIFGTDFPIDKYYYPKRSVTNLYKEKVKLMVNKYGEDVFRKWSNYNFMNVFNIY